VDEQPEPGSRLYSAHLDRWVTVAIVAPEGGTCVHVEGLDGSVIATSVPTNGLFPTEHYPAQIGTHEPDGTRTHTTPGEVCAACSDILAGYWVPVNDCSISWAIYEAHREAHGYGAYLWLT